MIERLKLWAVHVADFIDVHILRHHWLRVCILLADSEWWGKCAWTPENPGNPCARCACQRAKWTEIE